ncbi:MAG: glycosyltransferase family 9 protein [Candidatus Eremiobacteraeota bacterium]|nr:glycosyltransferase family 9 protein [Candidatus Eremiobacteraeota bacterium]
MNERAVLVCAGGGIGDSLVASVCARALGNRYDSVDAVCLPSHRDTLAHVPDIREIHVDDGGPVGEVARRLRARKYAAAVVTWATARTAQLALRAGIPIRVGQAQRLYSNLFTHRVTVRSERGDVTSHWSQVLLDYPRAIGCDTNDAQPHFAIGELDRVQARRILDARHVDEPFVVVHPTCAVSPKRPMWPVEGWIALVRALQAHVPAAVVLSGSAADAPIVERIANATGAASVAGATSIGGLAAIAESAAYFVVMHSGPMHVAAAVGAPTVGIFPLQADFPDRWAPLGPRVAVVRASFPCRRGERMETCPDYLCVQHLSIPRVLAAVDSLSVGASSGERA